MRTRPFYYRETEGIRITVRSEFVPQQSSAAAQRFVFAYYVRIENVGESAARLLTRRWLIHDSVGEETEVVGDGVVGEQPRIVPGAVHEYQSWCVLKSPSGYMEGSYHLVHDDDSVFDALVPRFLLDMGAPADPVS